MREIPGFYYDEEKKKYFKVTKDHLQSKNKKPCSSATSQSSRTNKVAFQFKYLLRKELHIYKCWQKLYKDRNYVKERFGYCILETIALFFKIVFLK